jgi:phosphatidylserine/phosphatidylglycerophosphate/cardiolipin synthase-like enzyme
MAKPKKTSKVRSKKAVKPKVRAQGRASTGKTKRASSPQSRAKAAAPRSFSPPPIPNSNVPAGTLKVSAYRGDGAVLLAFDMNAGDVKSLAGFSIRCTLGNGQSQWLQNRLSFSSNFTSKTTAETRSWTPSNEAPFQKFWWADFPRGTPGDCVYEVTAMNRENGSLVQGPKAQVRVHVGPYQAGELTVAFTRGYISSQAYAAEFQNAPIVPATKTIDFDTAPFEKQYAWLGANARAVVFDFLNAAARDPSISLDVFAYDIDEPDILRLLAKLGHRLRIVFDDCSEHTAAGKLEPQAWKVIQKSAGPQNVAYGHFKRFSHDKIFIQKKNGKATKVLTGSANWSIRGLYVQANSVLVFDDPTTAGLYEQSFQQSFDALPKGKQGTTAQNTSACKAFAASGIAKQWFPAKSGGLPDFSVAFSPHASAAVSLQEVADRIARAKTSVLFAIMQLAGGGPAMDAIRTMVNRPDIFTYGVSETASGLQLYKPDSPNAVAVPFSVLSKLVPPTFRKEWNGGMGMHIHHKFIVVDFNGDDPVAYMGSSNLAAGGEESNGDNLLEVRDPAIAKLYAVEAIRLVDHYHFRASLTQATAQKPLSLATDASWAAPYYDPKNVKYLSRLLFAGDYRG